MLVLAAIRIFVLLRRELTKRRQVLPLLPENTVHFQSSSMDRGPRGVEDLTVLHHKTKVVVESHGVGVFAIVELAAHGCQVHRTLDNLVVVWHVRHV